MTFVFNEPLHIGMPDLADEQEVVKSVQAQNVFWKTNRERWIIRIDDLRKSRKFTLVAQFNDDDLFAHSLNDFKYCYLKVIDSLRSPSSNFNLE